jgi:hypothetical protein
MEASRQADKQDVERVMHGASGMLGACKGVAE